MLSEFLSIDHRIRRKVRVKVGKYVYTLIDEALANNASDSDNSDNSDASNHTANVSATKKCSAVSVIDSVDAVITKDFVKAVVGEIRAVSSQKVRDEVKRKLYNYLLSQKEELTSTRTTVNACLKASQKSEKDIEKK